MRTYGKAFAYKKTVSYRQRQERLATEWDIRIDITSDLTPQILVENIKNCKDEWTFALVSGVELPDLQPTQGCATEGQVGPWTGGANQYGSKDKHVHIALVLLLPHKRADVLRMVRGPRKLGDEYAMPRNSKFTYAGWVIHHAKPSYKVEGEQDIIYECGDLPMDAFTTDNALAVERMLKKWGSPRMFNRFKVYTDLLKKHKIQEKIECLQMELEDHDA